MSSNVNDLALYTPPPTVTLFADVEPEAVVARASNIARVLAKAISDQHLYAPISGRKYPVLEAWTLLGMLMPLTISPHVTRTWQVEGDQGGWGAHAEARTLDGCVVSAADAYCMRDEEKWKTKPDHQVASMASTRACSRAMRLPLSFVMSLTGYEVTPAEEMDAAARGETISGGKGVAPGWKDLAEQQRAHADLGELIQQRGLREWVATWLESKGYTRPLAKGQLNQLRRAIEREQGSSRPAGDDGDPGRPAGANTSAPGHSPRPGAGQTSGPEGPDRGRQETTGSDNPVGGEVADG
jgi:hypothetical protein